MRKNMTEEEKKTQQLRNINSNISCLILIALLILFSPAILAVFASFNNFYGH